MLRVVYVSLYDRFSGNARILCCASQHGLADSCDFSVVSHRQFLSFDASSRGQMRETVMPLLHAWDGLVRQWFYMSEVLPLPIR